MGTNPSDVETYATNAEFVQPTSVALTASGLYITDVSSNGVRLVDSNGIITTVAGGGTNTGDGAFATNSTVRSVQSVISDKNGGFYFSESEEVWHVDGSGIMHRIAGTNHSGSSDSGLYATNAIHKDSPAGLAIDPLGRLALADAPATARRYDWTRMESCERLQEAALWLVAEAECATNIFV